VKAMRTSANWHVPRASRALRCVLAQGRSIFTLGVVNRGNARARGQLTLASRLLLIDYPWINSSSS